MKFRKTAVYRLMSLLVIGTLTMTSFGMVQAKSTSTSYQEEAVSSKTTQAKISSRLKKQFQQEDMVTFLVKMKAQTNAQKVAKEAVSKAKKQKLTAAKTQYTKRSAVVSELRATSHETQQALLAYLQKEQKNKQVKDIHSYYIVNGLAVTGTKEVMEKVASFPEVDQVLPNETRQIHRPVDLKSSKQNKQIKAIDGIEWNISQVHAPEAWALGYDGTGTVVASIDTGVEWDHPALKEKYRGFDPSRPNEPSHELNWYDATTGSEAPYDDLEHGTHVTGTMVGSEPDGKNQIGVAPGAKWIAVKAFSEDGGTDADLLDAGEWILAPKDKDGNPHPEKAPDVVNNSWGGGPGLDDWYKDVVNAWRAADIFPEFSAGNTDVFNPGGEGSIANPANYPEAFATGATDQDNKLGSFSLQGPSPYGVMKPDIAAPGVNIRSSIPGKGYEGGWNGTSMAGPHVSAVVALLRQVQSDLSVDEIEQVLMDTAKPLTDQQFPESPNNGYGAGLVDAREAITALTDGIGTIEGQVTKEGEDTEPPVFSHKGPNEIFAATPTPLTITAEDEVAVTNVSLIYQVDQGEWETLQANRTDGNHLKGTYVVQLPELEGENVTYRWIVKDFGENEAASDPYTLPIRTSITTGYTQDFEAWPSGWFSGGTKDPWQWGTPTTGPKQAFTGQHVYATNLDSPYENQTDAALSMPLIAVPESGSSYLQYQYWHDLEANYDYVHVHVQPEGEEAVQVAAYTGKTNAWTAGEVDLSAYQGQKVRVIFQLRTDGSVTKDGFYLDDVNITDQALPQKAKKQLGVIKKEKSASQNKKSVNPVNPKSAKPAKVKEKHTHMKKDKSLDGPSVKALPMKAQISVLESGKSTYTDEATGRYQLSQGAGEWTVKAEAYGFESRTQKVSVSSNEKAEANFSLQPLAKRTISGTVVNEATGDKVKNATVYLVEDAKIAPVTTDESGQFSLQALSGVYTVKVFAKGFKGYSFTADVTEKPFEKSVKLEPFIGVPGEIGYDDGTAENARAFYDPGNGWAVKFSLEKGKKQAQVTGGLFRFWTSEWPAPGGDEFAVEVYDASGKGGAPGEKIAGPLKANALRNGEWTKVDLEDQAITVDGDFYLVYIQTKKNTESPGLATDEDGPNAERSWQLTSGAFSPSPKEDGNYMIRALVNYEADVPEITSPKTGTITNKGELEIEGTASPGLDVAIYQDDEEVAKVKAGSSGIFKENVSVSSGEHVFTAATVTDKGSTKPSKPVKVIIDQTAPSLTIDTPKKGEKTNRESLTVEGKVADDHLDQVTVNGKKATVKDGKYAARVLLENGENTIKVIAKDAAGNKTTKKVDIDVQYDAPVISKLTPKEDSTLSSGESVKISFESREKLEATFVIHMPLTNARSSLQNTTELPIREVAPGTYEGYWTATSAAKAKGAVIEVIVKDEYGNVTREKAAGKLTINEK
ncbi:S8 family serine peptidase [Bacillus xiamenensis]|uniref:S8 family serine peptidase n=1 Tax=Bacillus xiamenensis TaxID=1178537 RepID=A0ABT4EYL4_9BACI|nr:S8 family peptidase [Bacillus xiamenensis]MCY9574895.1 S8 family serine peptidase [Bacillus xiamenensis]